MTSVVITVIFSDDEAKSEFVRCCAQKLREMGLSALQQSGPDTIIISAIQPFAIMPKDLPPPEELEVPAEELEVPAPSEEVEVSTTEVPPDASLTAQVVAEPVDQAPEPEAVPQPTPRPYADCAIVSVNAACAVPALIDESAERSALYARAVRVQDDAILFNFCGMEVKFPKVKDAGDCLNADSLCDRCVRVSIKFADGNDELYLVLLEVKERPAGVERDQVVLAKDLAGYLVKS